MEEQIEVPNSTPNKDRREIEHANRSDREYRDTETSPRSEEPAEGLNGQNKTTHPEQTNASKTSDYIVTPIESKFTEHAPMIPQVYRQSYSQINVSLMMRPFQNNSTLNDTLTQPTPNRITDEMFTPISNHTNHYSPESNGFTRIETQNLFYSARKDTQNTASTDQTQQQAIPVSPSNQRGMDALPNDQSNELIPDGQEHSGEDFEEFYMETASGTHIP